MNGKRPPRRAAAQVPVLDFGPLPGMLGYVLRRTELDVYQGYTQTLAELDLRPTQFTVLTIIGRNPGLRQTQVSEALGIKQANIVALLDSLEALGLAQRQHVASDRRSYFLFLTRKGEDVVSRATALVERKEHELMQRIGRNSRDLLLDLLRQLDNAAGSSEGAADVFAPPRGDEGAE
jgi:DNA-binding MarR family transcriptional regulator